MQKNPGLSITLCLSFSSLLQKPHFYLSPSSDNPACLLHVAAGLS